MGIVKIYVASCLAVAADLAQLQADALHAAARRAARW